PKQGIKFDQQAQIIKVPCLKLLFSTKTVHKPILDVKYIEIDDSFFYCCCLVHDQHITEHTNCIGIDLKSTGHAVVAANPKTGKVLKLSKKIWHTHKKYKNIRKKLQKKKKLKELKKIKDRESRIIRDLNHKI